MTEELAIPSRHSECFPVGHARNCVVCMLCDFNLFL